jgi:Zn-dependent M32 family carboxypeptidase
LQTVNPIISVANQGEAVNDKIMVPNISPIKNKTMKKVRENGKMATVALKNDVAGKAQMPEVLCRVLTSRYYFVY